MSNSFGRLFRVTTWGESHGPAIGAVIDGCPPGIALSETDIQPWLDRRRPGGNRHVSQRRESDEVRILSGTFEGRTTGAPIALQIDNEDARPKDYAPNADRFRPGHADFGTQAKYGLRDWRGGGRASARETAARVAAGAVARLIVPQVRINAWLVELGGDRIETFDTDEIGRNALNCPDPRAAERWAAMLDAARKNASSLGAVVECVAEGAPAGWGAPLAAKLDADLAGALMSIPAVKGVEIGDGFAAARSRGEDNVDEIRRGPAFLSNHAGGILGGISTGQPIILPPHFKPTSSLPRPLRTIDGEGADAEIVTTGRHDPCVAIRGAAVVEAMVALTLADHFLLHRAQCGA